MNRFFKNNLISIDSLRKEDIYELFSKGDEIMELVEKKGGDERLKGKIMAALFFEPSSRTFSSFITAMQRLGGGIIPLNGMANTSILKGETLEDTIKVFSSYADIIVVRFPEPGLSARCANFSSVPVINAGDGIGEHPTQALLDCYTINKHFSSFKDLNVGIIGDLLNGRTVHSLSKALVKLGVRKFTLISPERLRMPISIIKLFEDQDCEIVQTELLDDDISKLDIIYSTRIQKERFSDSSEYNKLKFVYVISPEVMEFAKTNAILMHPLPRVGEIDPLIDADSRALYFKEQIKNGLYIRMALLDLILNK